MELSPSNGWHEEIMSRPWATVLHMPPQWMHIIVSSSSGPWWARKCTWPRLGEMRTQRTQFKQRRVGRGHICWILRDSWHLYLLFVYIWAFTEMLKWFCKSFFVDWKAENIDKSTIYYLRKFMNILGNIYIFENTLRNNWKWFI